MAWTVLYNNKCDHGDILLIKQMQAKKNKCIFADPFYHKKRILHHWIKVMFTFNDIILPKACLFKDISSWDLRLIIKHLKVNVFFNLFFRKWCLIHPNFKMIFGFIYLQPNISMNTLCFVIKSFDILVTSR